MSQTYLTPSTMRTICQDGVYYIPAWRHYNTQVSVVCDRCNKTHLSACIGYQNYDLCLNCVDKISEQLYPSRPKKEQIHTYMMLSTLTPPHPPLMHPFAHKPSPTFMYPPNDLDFNTQQLTNMMKSDYNTRNK